nr:MAG TPA: hypothetical protein [Caudoviricetes sp.]
MLSLFLFLIHLLFQIPIGTPPLFILYRYFTNMSRIKLQLNEKYLYKNT